MEDRDRQLDRHEEQQGRRYVTGIGSNALKNVWANREYYEDAQRQLTNKKDDLEFKKSQLVGDDGKALAGNEDEVDRLAKRIEELNGKIKEAGDAARSFSGAGAVMRSELVEIGNSVANFLSRFGRQMFQKAIQEAKRFVQEFDADMNQIQTITMKSDKEMENIRSSTIDQAIGLKTSVSNVAQTKAALYRQGLSDAEVNDRTEDIIKFSKVTGMKVTNATKGLTAAIQTGLVGSVNEAMDALVALGDTAATTAEEITKGMQRSASAAENAGVSYNQLVTLLTIGTEKTQLGGAQIGRSLNTIFQRMTKVTTDNYVTAENGETTSINDVEEALNLAGVSLREGDKGMSFRSAFDVLRDLAGVWESLNDLQKSNVTYAMAGTARANVFQSLMDAMGEDGGAMVDKYLDTAENSEGITDKNTRSRLRAFSLHWKN